MICFPQKLHLDITFLSTLYNYFAFAGSGFYDRVISALCNLANSTILSVKEQALVMSYAITVYSWIVSSYETGVSSSATSTFLVESVLMIELFYPLVRLSRSTSRSA